MAQVIKNPDNTLTVTLQGKEQKTLKRWGDDYGRNIAAQLEVVLSEQLQNRREHYRGLDGPPLSDKYDALSAADQARVDAILTPTP